MFYRVFIAALLATSACAEEVRPPNILFIMSDDHTTQAIGAYGGHLKSLHPTPHIDRLAANGLRFERVFCDNALCTPSRATILTGQHSQTHGVIDLEGGLPVERQFLAHEMREAGYQTAVIGKWHLKEEPGAFDFYAVFPRQGEYFNPLFRVRGPRPWTKNTFRAMGKHSSDAVTDLSIAWLDTQRDKRKPFLLLHHFKAPHDMFHNAPRYDEWLEDVVIPEPENLRQPLAGSPGSAGFGSGMGKQAPWHLGKRLKIDPRLSEKDYFDATYQTYLKRYLRCVKGVDDNVGRLVQYLEDSGELDHTIIIYTGDQGFFLGEHDLMDKRWMYEEAMRMPFIVHWPRGIQQPGVNHWLINNTDFSPTLLELAGRPTPPYMQGRSFADALKGAPKPREWRDVTYYRYWMHLAHQLAVPAHFGIRSDRYKLIFFYGMDSRGRVGNQTPVAWEFYDLEKDGAEMNNRYGDPHYVDIIEHMKQQLRDTRRTLQETDAARPALQSRIDAHWR